MLPPALSPDETERLAALQALDLLDTPAEARFDRLTRLAARLFGVPIVLVTLVDRERQWFKSRHGLDLGETGRNVSFCGHAILQAEPFIVPDAAQDPRFADNPLVVGTPFIRFYAGMPVASPDGYRVGTLCLIDRQPRTLTADEIDLLGELAALVAHECDNERLHRALSELADSQAHRQAGEADRRRAEQRARAHHGVTLALAEMPDLTEAIPAVLQGLGDSLDWDAAIWWHWEARSRRLQQQDVWTADPALREPLRQAGSACPLALEAGIAGKAGEWQAAAWVGDVAVRPASPWERALAENGLHGLMAFALCSGNLLLGVVELASRQPERPDAEVLRMLEAIGSQIGQYQERQRMEEANRLYAEIVRHMQIALLVYQLDDADDDRTFRLIALNPGASAAFGRTAADLLGRNYDELFPDSRGRGLTARLLEVVRSGAAIDLDLLTYGDSQELVSAYHVKAFTISRTRLGMTFESVLETKRAEHGLERALVEAQAATLAKSEFLANMSHELRTPLNSVIGFSEMLDDELSGPLNAEQRDYVQTIGRNGRHLLNLINEILDLTKIEAGKLTMTCQPCDIQQIAADTIKRVLPQARKKALTLLPPAVTEPVLVAGDPLRIGQVLTNLLSNAIKFTPNGGEVAITVAVDGPMVAITVSDTGVGIPLEMQQRIFDAFIQVDGSNARQEEGTGLGLYLVRQLVELQGGKIWLISELGKGSSFGFTLPLWAGAEA
jgi:signal transduction histidine kinase